MRAVFTSDLHGNESQYYKLVDYAISTKADLVMIGGDLSPKNRPKDMLISYQAQFLKDRLPLLLSPLKKELPSSKLLILGNDDCKVNEHILEERPDLYTLINKKRIRLDGPDSFAFDIVGYSYVPISPFALKDWEKHDFSDCPAEYTERYAERKADTYRLNGIKSASKGWKRVLMTERLEKRSSIQKDLEKRVFTKDPEKTIYVIHTPPDGTCLDLVYKVPPHLLERYAYRYANTEVIRQHGPNDPQIPNSRHVGSMALRSFIEKRQPYLTLHGHIHETVDISGRFMEKIGRTICMSPGNDNNRESLALLVFDIDDPGNAERKII